MSRMARCLAEAIFSTRPMPRSRAHFTNASNVKNCAIVSTFSPEHGRGPQMAASRNEFVLDPNISRVISAVE